MNGKEQNQIIVKTGRNIDVIGKRIAATYDNWYYDNKTIYQRDSVDFGTISDLVSVTIFAAVGYALWYIIESIKTPVFDVITTVMVFIVIGILFNLTRCKKDEIEKVDYIKFEEAEGANKVLIEPYDIDGTRNLEDDELNEILVKIGGVVE